MDGRLKQQIDRLLQPIRTRISNVVARAVVQLVDDSTRLQLLQLGVLAGETIDDGERFQPYGLTSVPLAGAEAVVLFPGGDRSNPIVVAVDDRRHRPTRLEPGEVAIYNDTGAMVKFAKDGDVIATPAAGREVQAGGTKALALQEDLEALAQHVDTLLVGGSGSAASPPGTAPTGSGTGTLKGE